MIETITLEVVNCPACGLDHSPTRFVRADERLFTATCPVTGATFSMDTQAIPGVWEGLLQVTEVS